MNKGEKTRQYIIEKTAPIFNKKGFAGTSLTDMTEATGLTKGSIYGHFANKDEVALAVFDYNLRRTSYALHESVGTRKTAREQLIAFVDSYSRYLKEPCIEGGCPVLNTAIDADDTHPELKQRAADAINNWKRLLVQVITQGIKQKEIPQHVNPEQLALTIIATIEGAMMIWRITGKSNYRKMIVDAVYGMVQNFR